MARLARLVVPGTPHLVTQHGNRGDITFFQPGDYDLYLELLADSARRADDDLGLLPDAQPRPRHPGADRSRRPARNVCRGSPALHQLYQRPFALDRAFVAGALPIGGDGRRARARCAALRHAQSGPGRAGRAARGLVLVERACHITGSDDGIVSPGMVLGRTGDFSRWLAGDHDSRRFEKLRRAGTTGRPLGSPGWVAALEKSTGRTLAPLRRGPKRRLVMSNDVHASAGAPA